MFLDLPGDRYFALPEPLDREFQRWADGEAIDAATADALISAGVASPGKARHPSPAHHSLAARDLAFTQGGRAPMATIVTAMVEQLRARRRLRRDSLAEAIGRLGRDRRLGRTVPRRADGLMHIARAFAASALVLRAEDQCLPRAIAARALCNRHGERAALVFGVRLHPFAAHSWVQAADAVIVGDLEQVRLYTPILVIP